MQNIDWNALLPLLTNFVLAIPIAITSIAIYQFLLPGLLKWKNLKDELTVCLVKNANFSVLSILVGAFAPADRERYDIVYNELRRLSGEVLTINNVPLQAFWAKFNLLPSKEDVKMISKSLIGWSNNLVEDRSSSVRDRREERIEALQTYLKIEE